ncbi:MAG: pirin family protein [Nitrospirota bacterium]|nr:pirin family protein [Nitrospirota bacterium]
MPPDQTAERSISGLFPARSGMEGAGLPIRRTIGAVTELDPFLLLDHFGPVTWGPGEASGVPEHPHRGFETVTYLLDGRMEHRDSTGGGAVLTPGDVQWMTAGAGIVHSEMPDKVFFDRGGTLHGFQLWVNLPARLKMTPPRYQDISAAHMPVAREGGVTARVVVGEAMGVKGAVSTHIPITCIHYTMEPGVATTLNIPSGQNAGLYVFGGTVAVAGTRVPSGTLARLGEGDTLHMVAEAGEAVRTEVLMLAGSPIGEPVARYGPFVMNTYDEIRQAVADYQSGRMGHLRP